MVEAHGIESGCSEPIEHQRAIKSKFFNKELKTKKSLNERLLVEAHGIEPRTLPTIGRDALNLLS